MISVVIPVYNGAKYLNDAVQSVVNQTFAEWELLIVDDGSTDASREMARAWEAKDARIRSISQSNSGPSAARNHGYSISSHAADSIVFLDSDDVWEPDALETLHVRLFHGDGVAAAYGLARYIDANGKFEDPGVLEGCQRNRIAAVADHIITVPIHAPTTFAVEACTEAVMTAGTVLIRRDAYEKTGGWNNDIRMWEDWDLWLRLTRIGDMALVDKHVLRYRRHGANLSADARALEAGERDVRSRLLASLTDSPAYLEIARQGAAVYHKRVVNDRVTWARQALGRGKLVEAAKHLRHALRLKAQGPVH